MDLTTMVDRAHNKILPILKEYSIPVLPVEHVHEDTNFIGRTHLKVRSIPALGKVESITATHISVNLWALEMCKRDLAPMREPEIMSAYIKFILLHEYRHVWQAMYKPELMSWRWSIPVLADLPEGPFTNYRERPDEVDASRWALSQLSAFERKVVHRLFMIEKGKGWLKNFIGGFWLGFTAATIAYRRKKAH